MSRIDEIKAKVKFMKEMTEKKNADVVADNIERYESFLYIAKDAYEKALESGDEAYTSEIYKYITEEAHSVAELYDITEQYIVEIDPADGSFTFSELLLESICPNNDSNNGLRFIEGGKIQKVSVRGSSDTGYQNEGMIPHIHIETTDGRKIAVKLEECGYFDKGHVHDDHLYKDEIIAFNKWMKKRLQDLDNFKGDRNDQTTVWGWLCDEWNKNPGQNPTSRKVKEGTTQPDYSNLPRARKGKRK